MSEFDYDVLVVGSGFGGSVAALRLTEKGYRVGVMEAGRRFADDELPKTSWSARRYLWAPWARCFGIMRVTLLRDVLIASGTGVGGGLLIGGHPVHGAMHPELGHLQLRRAAGDSFAGICPFHGDCIEGLASGPALAARFGGDAATVPDTHPGWDHVASDIAALCGAILLTTAARRILFGGSIALHRAFLLPQVRSRLVAALGAYLPYLTDETAQDIVQVAGLGSDAGPLGAIALAAMALNAAGR
jgi:fructokinase